MIGIGFVYILTGVLFAGVAVLSVRDRSNPRRWRNAAFWGLFALSMLGGGALGDFADGCLIIVMTLIAAFGGIGAGVSGTTGVDARAAIAERLGDRLFIPALTIPAATLFGALVLVRIDVGGHPLIAAKQATPISLGLGVIAGLVVAFVMLRPRPVEPLQEARRLMDQVGWAALLPQTLAGLGVVFAVSGVGRAVGELAGRWLPLGDRFAAVCAFTFGMALLTAVMGNAFAAFPVMAAAIGLPLIVKGFHGDPAVMGAIGMLSGFCGTLVTPMAANFNIVPAALLELRDRNAVIKAQAPTAVMLLVANTLLMNALAFPR